MADLMLDEVTGDLTLVDGDLVLTEGPESVAQELRLRLGMFFSEWFLDESEGVPYVQEIFQKGTDRGTVDGILKREILSVPGVIELVEYNLELDDTLRKGTVTFTVRSTLGEVTVDLVLGG